MDIGAATERSRLCRVSFCAPLSRLLASLLFAVAVGYRVQLPSDAWKLIANFTMFQTIFSVEHINPVYWTLWIEMIFYMLVALFLFVGRRHWLIWMLTALMCLDILAVIRTEWDRVRVGGD